MQEVSGCKPAHSSKSCASLPKRERGGGCAGGCFSERYDSVFSFPSCWAEQETNALPNAGTDTCSCMKAEAQRGLDELGE